MSSDLVHLVNLLVSLATGLDTGKGERERTAILVELTVCFEDNLDDARVCNEDKVCLPSRRNHAESLNG